MESVRLQIPGRSLQQEISGPRRATVRSCFDKAPSRPELNAAEHVGRIAAFVLAIVPSNSSKAHLPRWANIYGAHTGNDYAAAVVPNTLQITPSVGSTG
jgi:hypothetical protein